MGQGEVGGCTHGCKQHGHLCAWLEKGLYRVAISVLFGINGLRNKLSHLVGPPFSAFKAGCFLAIPGWHFPEALIENLLIGGVSRIWLG